MKKEIYFPKGADRIIFDLEKGIATAIYEEEKPALNVGEWYNLDDTFIALHLGKYNNVGFDTTQKNKFRSDIFMTVPEDWKPADMSKVKELLIKEAEKMGFKDGVMFKSATSDTVYTFSKVWFSEDAEEQNIVWSSDGGIIFEDGKWAEIVGKKPLYINAYGTEFFEGDAYWYVDKEFSKIKYCDFVLSGKSYGLEDDEEYTEIMTKKECYQWLADHCKE